MLSKTFHSCVLIENVSESNSSYEKVRYQVTVYRLFGFPIFRRTRELHRGRMKHEI